LLASSITVIKSPTLKPKLIVTLTRRRHCRRGMKLSEEVEAKSFAGQLRWGRAAETPDTASEHQQKSDEAASGTGAGQNENGPNFETRLTKEVMTLAGCCSGSFCR
jgi:hypothetical protein